jgi:tRNA threonylcarbamoyladenosine biosynthesis protein TsaB
LRRLAIETATDACSVALFQDDRLIGSAHELVGRGHAERLIGMIADLPDRGRADQILVDCGPGSFTGVRVGLAAARALGFAWGGHVRGYSSLPLLAGLAFAETGHSGMLAVVIVGGHGEYFVQRFSGSPVRPITSLASLRPEQAAAVCGHDMLVGSGAEAIRAAGATGHALPLFPDARATALLPPDLIDLPPRPIYGRGPDARLPA